MSDGVESTTLSPLAQALGRVPSGLYVVASVHGERRLGFVGSFVMQQGFDPPILSVAVGKGRDHLKAIRASGRFAVSVLDAVSSGLMGAFFRKHEGSGSAFDQVETGTTPGGLPFLAGALAWLECEVTGEHETGDHVVVFGRVTAGEKLREGEPSLHVRRNGLSY